MYNPTKKQGKSNNKRSIDGRPTAPWPTTYIAAAVGGVFLLDQLLGTLDLVQGDTLGRASRFADSLGVRFPLSFTLFVARRWHEGSARNVSKKKMEVGMLKVGSELLRSVLFGQNKRKQYVLGKLATLLSINLI